MRRYVWSVALIVLAGLGLKARELVVKLSPESNSLPETITETFALSKNVAVIPLRFSAANRSPQSPNDLPLDSERAPLGSVFVLRFQSDYGADSALAVLKNTPGVEYVEPNHVYKTFSAPSDSLFSRQWYLENIHAVEAWNLESGNPEVIVGIIDTGVDYRHEDLQGQFWVNSAEDLNGNGMLDSSDVNGIDEDGNGYPDDVIGWDFTDAPRFPDQGDYVAPDNDPMDEFMSGHGTAVAGIIAARRDNGSGISGIAPNIRFMILRAGTASGFLEEDDVAEAILYAVDNGCDIINMSFGDVNISYLLQDAIRYGVQKGVLFVAASGNNGNTEPNYPAAFDETISVGATTASDAPAGFSSYGSKLNIVAPGQEVLTCQIGDQYGFVNGTSFAAPMVSAALALIKSKSPQLNARQIQGALFAGATDLYQSGWDVFTGHGLLNVLRSLQVAEQGYAQIEFPRSNQGLNSDSVAIIGSAFGSGIQEYHVSFGLGEIPTEWQEIGVGINSQVLHDTLAIWNISGLPDTVYTLELKLKQFDLPDLVFRTSVFVDRSPPHLEQIKTVPLQQGIFKAELVELSTNEPTVAILRSVDSSGNAPPPVRSSQYFRSRHYFLLSQQDFPMSFFYDFQLYNSSGLSTYLDNDGNHYLSNLGGMNPIAGLFAQSLSFPFRGYYLNRLADFDEDYQPELVLSYLNPENEFGAVQIREFENGEWQLKGQTSFPGIPRDFGDISGNGTQELLIGYGGTTYILRAAENSPFPTQIAWVDTSNFWGSRLVNLDADPSLELLAIVSGQWGLFNLTEPDVSPLLVQTFENSTPGNNQYGVPRILVQDFDVDGLPEVVFGDYDGDILIFSRSSPGSPFQLTRSWRLPGIDATNLIEAADVDGDGAPELIAVSQVKPGVETESNVDGRYWNMGIWKIAATNATQIWEKNFYGVVSARGIFNGLSASDVDADGRAELFFSAFPAFYFIEFEEGKFQVRSYVEGVNSNTILPFTPMSANSPQILANSAEGLKHYDFLGTAGALLPPVAVSAIPLDTTVVSLNWWPAQNAEYYRVYRKANQDRDFVLRDSTQFTAFIDSGLTPGVTYNYAISSVKAGFPPQVSPLSAAAVVTPNSPPLMTRSEIISENQFLVEFNEPLSEKSFRNENFRLNPGDQIPLSTIRNENKRGILLSFRNGFVNGTNILQMFNVSDFSGTPTREDTLVVPFVYRSLSGPALYLRTIELLNLGEILLIFSLPVDAGEASRTGNYLLEPDGKIVKAWRDEADFRRVHLQVDQNNRLGTLGVPYFVTVLSMSSETGLPLNTSEGNRLQIVQSAKNLKNVLVYPNPYVASSATSPLRFGNLPARCEIFIFTASGKFLKKLVEKNGDGGIIWDLKTEQNELVSSGVYLYLIKAGSEQTKGKFLIVR